MSFDEEHAEAGNCVLATDAELVADCCYITTVRVGAFLACIVICSDLSDLSLFVGIIHVANVVRIDDPSCVASVHCLERL